MSSIYGCRSPPEIPESTMVLSTKDLKVMRTFVLVLNLDGVLMMAHGEYLAAKKIDAATLLTITTDENFIEEAMVALPLMT